MGVWGIGLFDSDMTSDVRDDYLHLLRKKKTSSEAINLLKEDYNPDRSDDGYLFWLAIAVTQWEYGHLSEEVTQMAVHALSEAAQDERWESLSKRNCENHKKVLDKVAQTLASPQPKEKKITPYRGAKSRFKIGEIYSTQFIDFQAANLKNKYIRYAPYSFKFGGFCVVDIEQKEDLRENVLNEYPVVVLFDWVGEQCPTQEDIDGAPILEYDDRGGRCNSFLGAAPEKFDYNRNQFKLIGYTERFSKNHFTPIHPEYYRIWSSLQFCIIENHTEAISHGDG